MTSFEVLRYNIRYESFWIENLYFWKSFFKGIFFFVEIIKKNFVFSFLNLIYPKLDDLEKYLENVDINLTFISLIIDFNKPK